MALSHLSNIINRFYKQKKGNLSHPRWCEFRNSVTPTITEYLHHLTNNRHYPNDQTVISKILQITILY